MTEFSTDPIAVPAVTGPDGAKLQLARLCRLIGEQFAEAVNTDQVDIDTANGMLEAFGLPELPRRWQVRIRLPLTCEVTATTEIDAFDAATDAVDHALRATVAGADIDIEIDGRDDLQATPGAVDTDAIAADWLSRPWRP
jgi:hypothetical protein